MSARLRSAGLWIAIAWLYLYSFPYFPAIHSANELPRVYLTWAMAEEGRFAIDTGVERWGTTVDVSPVGDHVFSNKAPGSSFLAVPAYLVLAAGKAAAGAGEPTLAEMVWVCRVFTGVIPSLLFLLLLARFLRRFAAAGGDDDDHAGADGTRLAVLGYALGSMAMTYSVLFIAHQLSAVCIGTAYIVITQVVEDRRDSRWLLAAGAAAGCAPLVDYQAAFAGVPLAAYLIWKLVAARRPLGVLWAALGSIPPVALLLYYHWRAFGSPFKTGYDFSQTFAHFHQQGFLGMTGPTWKAFVGSTLTPDNGLFFLCPMLVLIAPGVLVLWRRGRRDHALLSAAVVLIYLAFISSITFWRGGWQMGPRYITAMLPFAMVPVAAALGAAARRWTTRAGAVAVVVPGVVIYALSCALFPHFPETFKNPVFELTLRLLGDGLAPYNLGTLVGLTGLASLLPYLAVLAAAIWTCAAPARRHLRAAVVGLTAAALILALYSLAPGGGARAERAYQWVRTTFPR
ncbi:glycosyltransferase family 39 protein [Haliangium sp.]|uniref:glycosyltransferase family 39 protein n=1 Tax=Haliangium sp. TaxID=2663208 RepID=UPI003D148292